MCPAQPVYRTALWLAALGRARLRGLAPYGWRSL